MQKYLVEQRQEGGEFSLVAEVVARWPSEAVVLTQGDYEDWRDNEAVTPFVAPSTSLVRPTRSSDYVMDGDGFLFEVLPNALSLAKRVAELGEEAFVLDEPCTGSGVQVTSRETWELFVPHYEDKNFFRPYGTIQALHPEHAACLFIHNEAQAKAGELIVNDDCCVWEITGDGPIQVTHIEEHREVFQLWRHGGERDQYLER